MSMFRCYSMKCSRLVILPPNEILGRRNYAAGTHNTPHGSRSEMRKIRRAAAVSKPDQAAIGLLLFFIVVACTTEIYFVFHYRDIREQTGLLADLYAIYGMGDETYYGRGNIYFPLAVELINCFVTQVLNALLIWAIIKGKTYRHPVQLAVSAYMSYSVVLYFLQAYVSGFEAMPEHNAWGYFIFFVPNLPWLLGNLYLATQSFQAIRSRFHEQRSDTRPASHSLRRTAVTAAS
jgi:hypothetical protein